MIRRNRALAALGILYAVASLVHFAHNAEYLNAYPNLPAWLTRYEVYGAWLGITTAAMNATILFEVSVAACLLLTVVTLVVPHLKQGGLHD